MAEFTSHETEGGIMDPKYEFSAPKFHDFLSDYGLVANDDADSWFDNRRITNASAFHFGDIKYTFDSSRTTSIGFDDQEDEEGEMEIPRERPSVYTRPTPQKEPTSAFKSFQRPELTVPVSPMFLRRLRNQPKAVIPTTEELILRRIEEEKQRVKRQIEENQEALRKVQSGAFFFLPSYSTKPLTTPEEPNFSARLDFRYPRERSAPPSPPKAPISFKKPGEVTVPIPFNFHTGNRAQIFSESAHDSLAPSSSPFVPLKIRALGFQKDLRKPVKVLDETTYDERRGVTTPSSPFLLTKIRSESQARPKPLKTEELQLSFLRNIPKFKAKEVDRKIFENPPVAPFVSSKPLTEPQPFEFRTLKRKRERTPENENERAREEEKKENQGKYGIVNRKIFERVIGVPPKRSFVLTVPQSPKITKKPTAYFESKYLSHYQMEEELPKKEVYVRSGPTQPEPFDLIGEEISRRKRQKREQELERERERERERHNFKAQPIYFDFPEQLPVVERKPLTQPAPFDLETDKRGDHYKRLFSQKVLEQQEQLVQSFNSFRAKPAEILSKSPFVPKRSLKPLTEVDTNIVLHSEIRSREREKFDHYLREKEKFAQELEEQRKYAEAERERREVQDLRKRMVHQAQPIQYYPPILIKPSQRPLTEPASPLIGNKRRLNFA